MSDVVVCPTCQHPNAVDASFCEVDDTWLGGEHRTSLTTPTQWADSDVDGAARAEDGTPRGPAGSPRPPTPRRVSAADDVREVRDDERSGRRRGRRPRAPGTRLGPIDPAARRTPPRGRAAPQRDTASDDEPGAAAPATVADEVHAADRVVIRRDLSGPRCGHCGRIARPGATTCPRCDTPLDERADERPVRGGAGVDRSRDGGRSERHMSSRVFAARQRAGNDGRRARFDQPLAARVIWFRSLAVALVGLLAVGLALGWHVVVTERLQPVIVRALPGLLEPVGIGLATSPGMADDDAFRAVDTSQTTFEPMWSGPASAGGDCASTADITPELVVSFTEATSVHRFSVTPGRPADDRTRLNVARPARLDLLFDNGQCVVVDVPDAPDEVQAPVSLRGEVGSVRIIIAEVHPAAGGGETTVAIQEVSFDRR